MRDDDDEVTTPEDRFFEIRKCIKEDMDAVMTLYSRAIDDFKFAWVDGEQWDAAMTALRGNRPRYEFNILRQSIKQVINDNRRNTPTIKVRPVENGDVEMAEIRQGLIRNIESQSNADIAYDWGGLYAITAGFGCWRVTKEYVGDDSFDQDIVIKRIDDPFSVFFDHAARELNRSDARRVAILQNMPKSEFKRRWPKATVKSFDSGLPKGLYYDGWYTKDMVRVAEYWYKTSETKTIYKLSDGRVVEAEGFDLIRDQAANPPIDPQTGEPAFAPITVEAEREVTYDKIRVEVISGDEVLEGPTDWEGDYFGIIPCWGDIVSIEGADYWYGMVRMARDAQILHNFSQSNLTESVATQPRAPFLATPLMLEGHEDAWQNMAVDNPPMLPYNPDPSAPGGMPQRQAPPQLASAWFDLSRINTDNLKAVTGIHDASLGRQSNETSGRAILARQQEGDVANFDYTDNIARAIQWTGVVVNNLISKIYTSERDLRILGEGDAEKYIRANQPVWVPDASPEGGHWEKINDMTAGKYDVVCTVGPSFTTQRMETLEVMGNLAQGGGPLAPLFSWAVLKYMDAPGISEMADIAKKMLIAQGVPVTQDPGEEPVPPPQPPPPNPKDVAQAENYAAQAKLNAAKAAQIMATTPADIENTQADTESLQADALRSASQAGQAAGLAPNPLEELNRWPMQ